MFTFLKPYTKAIIISLALMTVELIVELWHPMLMKTVIDQGIMERDLGAVMWWGGLMIAVAIFGFVAGITNSYFSSYVSQHFGYDVRSKLFLRIQSFSVAAFNKLPASALITRMTSDVNQLQNVVFMGLRIMPRAPLMMIGALIMALLIDVRIAGILLITVPICVLVLVWMMKRGFQLFRAVQNQLDSTNSIVRENLIGMRLIKAFVRYRREISRFADNNKQLMDRTVSALRLIEMTIPLLLLLMNVSILVILWFGNWQLEANGINEGDVVAIVIYATRITATFGMLSHILMSLARARASASRINEVLQAEDPGDGSLDFAVHEMDAEAEESGRSSRSDVAPASESVAATEEEQEIAASHSGAIAFDAVTFRYPGTHEPVLKDITFEVEPGQTVAVMGATGSGKTSLFQLLPRLYACDEGTIYIDGVDIRTLQVESLRKTIGMVPQEVVLFTGTVADNIRWGRNDATMEEIIEAAKHAQIHETIMGLERQYETVVGQKGVNLSGGQKQRLSIARALVREPRLLLLDDSTSALDLKTEAKLMQALKSYSCTTLIITQKVSTAIHADSVILLDQGCLLAQGTHEQLAESSELYRRIIRSQFGEKAVSGI